MGESIARDARAGWKRRRTPGFIWLALALVSTLALVFAVWGAPGASAAESFTWSGALAAGNPRWSAAENWESNAAPEASTAVGNLDFPHTPSSTCTPEPQFEFCYFASFNNLSGLSAESLSIDDGQEYFIFGEPITLGSGGISAAPTGATGEPALAELDLPITLGASQTWHVFGGGGEPSSQLYLGAGVSGPAEDSLAIDVGNAGAIYLGGDNEVGPLTIDGTQSNKAGGLNGIFGLFGAGLNATDGQPVNVDHVFFYGAGGLGALSTEGAEMYVALGGNPPEGTLETASTTLDSATQITFEVAGDGIAPGSDYSRLFARGAVELGSAGVVVRRTQKCSILPIGRTYTFVSTEGSLTGAFGNAPDGGEIPIKFSASCGSVSEGLRLAYDRSGTTQVVTGTVVAGPTSTTMLESSPGAPTTNQRVTLSARVEGGLSSATGTVEFQDNGVPIPGCSAVSLSGGLALCRVGFAAAQSPEHLVAVFSPGEGVNLKGSTSAPRELTVGVGPTATALSISGPTPSVGESVSYTAIVTPTNSGASSPSGSVEFLDDGAPISSCSQQPLGASSAGCQLSYSAPGAHTITARYSGDENFAGSASASARTLTVLAPVPAPGPPNQPVSLPSQQVAASSSQSGGVALLSSTLLAPSGGATASLKLHCAAPGGVAGSSPSLLLWPSRPSTANRTRCAPSRSAPAASRSPPGGPRQSRSSSTPPAVRCCARGIGAWQRGSPSQKSHPVRNRPSSKTVNLSESAQGKPAKLG